MLELTLSEVINRKYDAFIKKNGYIPLLFETYNSVEVKDVMPCITTAVGSIGGSSNVLISEIKKCSQK